MASLLVIDDNPADIALLREALAESGAGVSVEAAHDGREAAGFLAGNGVDAWPDLALLDLNMRGVDGRQFLAWRRQDARAAMLPVFVLSSSALVEDIADCDRLGADAYLVKPYAWSDEVALADRLARFVDAGEPVAESALGDAPARQRDAWQRWIRARRAVDGSWRRVARTLDLLARRAPI